MLLKQLEINGFKSFSGRTALEFPKGVTAIVGPNGSGKSNIADGIRFVLGEQSLKILRSKKGEDLIFSGSPSRARASQAKVALILDNKNKIFDVDFDEVVLGRRISRDGTSEYLLNNSSIRLKDINEMIARAKMGLRGYTVINQGMGDLILNATPLERREIIEDSVGLKEFQLKKKESQDKLFEAKNNLKTAKQLVSELEPHLKFLKRQMGKFEAREELQKKLEDLEKKYVAARLKEIESGLEKFKNQDQAKIKKIKELESEIQKFQQELQNEMKETKNFFDNLSKEENILKKMESERVGLERELGRLEGMLEIGPSSKVSKIDIQLVEKKLLDMESRLEEINSRDNINIVTSQINAVLAKIRKFLTELSGLKSGKTTSSDDLLRQKNVLQEKLKLIEAEIQKISENIKDIKNSDAGSRQQFFERQNKLRQAENELFSLKESLSSYEKEKSRLEQERLDLESEFVHLRGSLDGIKIDLVPGPEVKKEIERLRARLELASEIDPETQKEFNETQTRHEFLTTQSQDLIDSTAKLQEVIKQLDEKISDIFEKSFDKIKSEFDRFFKMLFGGGRAELKIKKAAVKSDELDDNNENIENEVGGVEIKVDLPGKRLKGLSALSGGERALTSVALVFALVSQGEPPFLVLDEVDAPLDEANSVRFAKILNELSRKTQFLVITHNRETMKQADVLYGITMEEEGVSKLLSIKLEKAEEFAPR